MDIDHVHFYVPNAEHFRAWLVHTMGFKVLEQIDTVHTQTEKLQTGRITVLVSSPQTPDSSVATYLQHHPPGVADLAFRVRDLEKVLKRVRSHQVPILKASRQQATIQGWGDLHHTLIQQAAGTDNAKQTSDNAPVLLGIDHAVLNVERHQLQDAVRWYQTVLGFEIRDYFNIQTQRSALSSQVLAHPEGTAQFPINEPASLRSQIQEFLDFNGGSGIQHIALSTISITETVRCLRQRGLAFLDIPTSYYTALRNLPSSDLEEIATQQILVERQTEQQMLLQAFSRPIFEQPTFFFEIIERRYQAQGFGERNFKALFEAIERQQLQRGTLV